MSRLRHFVSELGIDFFFEPSLITFIGPIQVSTFNGGRVVREFMLKVSGEEICVRLPYRGDEEGQKIKEIRENFARLANGKGEAGPASEPAEASLREAVSATSARGGLSGDETNSNPSPSQTQEPEAPSQDHSTTDLSNNSPDQKDSK